jgi:hypothetical protein
MISKKEEETLSPLATGTYFDEGSTWLSTEHDERKSSRRLDREKVPEQPIPESHKPRHSLKSHLQIHFSQENLAFSGNTRLMVF